MEKKTIKKILIAKDGFPLEYIKGRYIVNFLRRILHSSHYECRECYTNRTAVKRSGAVRSN